MGNAEFFTQLETFTRRWVSKHMGDEIPMVSPWNSGEWSEGNPRGAIIHFTADDSLGRVLSWFLRAKWNSRASAHAVIAPAWTDELREMAEGLELISKLSAPVFQVVPPDFEAWHATWTNGWAYGIENLNIGELQSRGGQFFSWRPRDRSAPDWTTPWDTANGEPVPLYGRWWCPHPIDQIAANAQLLMFVQEYCDQQLERELVLGHECVQSNKRDPGPDFPVQWLRRAIFDGHWEPMHEFGQDFMRGQDWRDRLCMAAYDEADPEKATEYFREEARTYLGAGKKWSETTLALQLLGYASAATTRTIEVFQRMMGIGVDGVVGPNTRRALLERLEDRGLV